jgi:hypothetical protein
VVLCQAIVRSHVEGAPVQAPTALPSRSVA